MTKAENRCGTIEHTNMREHLIIGNWKMNPGSQLEARKLLRDLVRILPRPAKGKVAVALPYPYLGLFEKTMRKQLLLGAQDVSPYSKGAHTGDVSASMLRSLDVTLSIIGHSERRADGENNEIIARKIETALRGDLRPILCVGERERDPHGKYFGLVEEQVRTALLAVRTSVGHQHRNAKCETGDARGRP
jgi:triosephosphate isomerase (TIM)